MTRVLDHLVHVRPDERTNRQTTSSVRPPFRGRDEVVDERTKAPRPKDWTNTNPVGGGAVREWIVWLGLVAMCLLFWTAVFTWGV
jgi:hypothetical protein